MRDIPGYEGLYAATEDGRVWSYPKQRSSRNGKWMKPQLVVNKSRRVKSRSHYQVALRKDGKYRSFLVHRLVAMAYLPNLANKPDINHRDGNTLNNSVGNLEWCTKVENMQHAIRYGLVDFHSGKQDETRRENGRKTIALNNLKRKYLAQQAVA